MKNFFKSIRNAFFRFFFSLFYKRKYLKGRYFDNDFVGWFWCFRGINGRLFGNNRKVRFPVHPQSTVINDKNLEFDVDDIVVFQAPGCYWQNHKAKIIIGKGCYVAPNVGFITTNHDVYNLDNHVDGKDIKLGDNCWIGMNSMVLPGVELGDRTIVGAGSVVTKSFPEGNVVIVGNPAKVVKNL